MYRLLLESNIQQMRPQLLHLFIDLLEILVQVLVDPRECIFKLLYLRPHLSFYLIYSGLDVFLHGSFTILHFRKFALENLSDFPQLLDMFLYIVPLLLVILGPLLSRWVLGDFLLCLDHVNQSINPDLDVGHALVHVLFLLDLPVSTL